MANPHAPLWWEGFSFVRVQDTVEDVALTRVLCSARCFSRGQRGQVEAAPGAVGHMWALGSAPQMTHLL